MLWRVPAGTPGQSGLHSADPRGRGAV